MPRKTHQSPKPDARSTYDELRNLHLALQVRTEQVKLRRLEWDTQTLALPQITPMPGDGPLQLRQPIAQGDLPAPNPPVARPKFDAGMPHDIVQTLMDMYMGQLRDEHDRNPYNKLASISAQAAKMTAAKEPEIGSVRKGSERGRRWSHLIFRLRLYSKNDKVSEHLGLKPRPQRQGRNATSGRRVIYRRAFPPMSKPGSRCGFLGLRRRRTAA